MSKELRSSIFAKGDIPYLIAGPCSAETREQVMGIAHELKKSNKVHCYRAGIWKPRTRPGTFEGVGAKGLPWLQAVKEEVGIPVTTEVANAKHVEQCLNYNIDVLWIGARTAVNPFAVQEIANALKGVDVPVLLKNPMNPDLDLWLGGVERLQEVGVTDLGVIHRGFSHLGEKFYRNRPQWQIPIEFKRRKPEIPIICDPSHICGRRDILEMVAQKALDLDFDGLMIETHTTPDEAWSDAKQQITPVVLDRMISDLVLRHGKEGDENLQNELSNLRDEIGQIDKDIFDLLSSRMEVAQKIGVYKKANDITILQQKQWSRILDSAISRASNLGISEEFIIQYLKAIHDESIRQQQGVMNDKS